MLLEVSQLLTALLSPFSPVEENHCMVPSQVFGETDRAPWNGLNLKAGKPITDLEHIHGVTSSGGDD